MTFFEALKQFQMPRPGELVATFKKWVHDNGLWWLVSVVGHTVALAAVLAVLSMMPAMKIQADAPEFKSDLDTAMPEPDLTHFEVGDTPIEPTVLNTETLSMVEAPQIEQTEQMNDDSAIFEAAGGGISTNTKVPNVGGLGGFDIKAIGPGPAVRGPGGVGVGVGTGGGPGSGGSGSGFGGRGSGSRKAMVGGFGGTKATERAVAAGLNWLARHQNSDGSWSLGAFDHNCKDGRCNGGGKENSNSAATAFALLPFLAAGQTHETKGPYQKTIASGLNWMMRNQKPDGNLAAGAGQTMYSHGLAAIVMCEAYGLSKDAQVGKSAQMGIRFIEAAQSKVSGSWVYQPAPTGTGGDTSVHGWQLMALKSGQMAGLEVKPATLEGSRKWLTDVSRGKSGGLFCYNTQAGPGPTMTAVGLLCTQYQGAKREDEAMVEGMNYLMSQLPSKTTRNCYYWYYATQVMHHLTGPEWDQWNRDMRRILIDQQVKEGCATGSWDPEKPTKDAWADQGGRIMVTSIALLTLEVYYRYLPLYQINPSNTMASAEKMPAIKGDGK